MNLVDKSFNSVQVKDTQSLQSHHLSRQKKVPARKYAGWKKYALVTVHLSLKYIKMILTKKDITTKKLTQYKSTKKKICTKIRYVSLGREARESRNM